MHETWIGIENCQIVIVFCVNHILPTPFIMCSFTNFQKISNVFFLVNLRACNEHMQHSHWYLNSRFYLISLLLFFFFTFLKVFISYGVVWKNDKRILEKEFKVLGRFKMHLK
jgi:hypothetical protein